MNTKIKVGKFEFTTEEAKEVFAALSGLFEKPSIVVQPVRVEREYAPWPTYPDTGNPIPLPYYGPTCADRILCSRS